MVLTHFGCNLLIKLKDLAGYAIAADGGFLAGFAFKVYSPA
jgi:hypothetical protein